jgi:hypothetical protein
VRLAVEARQVAGRPSLLKKRSKKLLVLWASGFPGRLSPFSQKFFGSFFQKRTLSLAVIGTGP